MDHEAYEVELKNGKKIVQDQGWAWVIALAAFFLYFIADGAILSFGVFFTELLHYFGAEKSRTAWIGSLLTSVPMLAGPIASKLIKRFGYRSVSIFGSFLAFSGFLTSMFAPSLEVLCLTMGVITGLGLACVFVSSIVAVSFYFKKYRSMATGIATCGSGIGMFVYSPLVQILLVEYGWKGTTLIISAFFLNMVAFSACLRPVSIHDTKTTSTLHRSDTDTTQSLRTEAIITPLGQQTAWTNSCTDIGHDKQENKQVTSRKKNICFPGSSCTKTQTGMCTLLSNRVYTVFWFSNFLLYMWYDTFYLYLQDHVYVYGISHGDSALLLSVIGILNTAGLLLFGFLGDRSFINATILYAVSIMVCGVSVALLPLLHTYPPLVACSAVFGFTISANYALESIILVKLLGLRAFTEAYGYIYFGQGVANLIGPPLAGLIYDIRGNYDMSFYISGAMVFVSGFMLIFISQHQPSGECDEEEGCEAESLTAKIPVT